MSQRNHIRIYFLHRVVSDIRNKRTSWVHLNRHLTRAAFEKIIRNLKKDYDPISMDDCFSILSSEKPITGRYCVLTFDDGYVDNLTNAVPILQQHSVPALFYIVTSPLVGKKQCLWYDEIYEAMASSPQTAVALPWFSKSLPEGMPQRLCLAQTVVQYLKYLPCYERTEKVAELLASLEWDYRTLNAKTRTLDLAELQEIARHPLFTIGGHTHTHQILSTLTPEEAAYEITTCAHILQEKLGIVPRHFAYPNGREKDSADEHKQLIRQAGFFTATNTLEGDNLPGDDMYSLRRHSLSRRTAIIKHPSLRKFLKSFYPFRRLHASCATDIGLITSGIISVSCDALCRFLV